MMNSAEPIVVPLSGPRTVPVEALRGAFDGLDAVRAAVRESQKRNDDVYLIAAFPANQTVYWNTTSGLSYNDVKAWAVNVFSPSSRRVYAMMVTAPDHVENLGDSPADNDVIASAPMPLPKIGSMQAIGIASRSNLIFADWKDFAIRQCYVHGKWNYVWYIPYRGKDSSPITIDANSGQPINDIQTTLLTIAMSSVTTINEKRNEE